MTERLVIYTTTAAQLIERGAVDVVEVVTPGPQGPAGAVAAAYVFTVSSPLDTWTVNHNLGYRPDVHVYTAGSVEVDADVVHVSANQTVITFAVPFAGYARLF